MRDKLGRTPLHNASIYAAINLPVIDLRGADPNLVSKVLHRVALAGNNESVMRLVEGGADIDATDNEGGSPLSLSAQQGHLDIVCIFCPEGADMRSSTNGWTVLHKAAYEGHLETV